MYYRRQQNNNNKRKKKVAIKPRAYFLLYCDEQLNNSECSYTHRPTNLQSNNKRKKKINKITK